MGAGSSNSVKNIQIEQEKSDGLTDKQSKSSKQQVNAGTHEKVTETPKSSRSLSHENIGDVEKLTQQLCESESIRLDLEDRVQSLEEELERINAKAITEEEKPCDETLHVKDQYIAKLEREKKDVETEFQKMKVRHKKKVKQLTTQMAEYKQEVNFQVMELKEEISKLQQEVKDKQGAITTHLTPSYLETDDQPKLPGGEKMKLILELSEQVAEQQDKIAALEKKLSEKDQIVKELRTKLKNNAEYLKAVNGSSEATKSENRTTNSNKNLSQSQSYTTSSQNKYSYRKPKELSKTNSLVDHEFMDDSDENDSMVKLSSLLRGVKSSKDDKKNVDLSDEEIANRLPNLGRGSGYRGDEGDTETGRDSGLGSAGKREEERKKNKEKIKNMLPDWRDSGSGLSDSDFERDTGFSSKISSAPPALQNRGNRKQKKKSCSLKQRLLSHDRPPRPGMAFMNSVVEETPMFGDTSNLSPVISPVQVS